MSVVTKVFVVLNAILSIALSMAVVSFVARQENWKEIATDARQTALSMQADVKVVAAQLRLAESQHLAMTAEMNAKNGALMQTNAELQAATDAKATEITQLKNQVTSLVEGSLTGLERRLAVMQEQLVSEQEFGRKLAKRNNEIERRNIDLNDRNKELVVSLAMMDQQGRAYLEQIAALEQRQGSMMGSAMQVPDAMATVQPVPSAVPGSTPAIATIRGEIREISSNLASISVGSADGVSEGMSFMVYRPGTGGGEAEYVATIEITRVNANEAAGVVVRPTNQQHSIRIGDSVRNEDSFASR